MKSSFVKQKKLKKLTRDRLEFLALRYVGRYAATRAMLDRVLERHIKKAALHHSDFSINEAMAWKKEILTRAERKKWVDDEALAKRFVEGGKTAGLSRRKIQQKLLQKGVAKELIAETYQAASEESSFDDMDMDAAKIYARKKGLGPYRKNKNADPQKELAKLCRAGFSLEVALKTLKLSLEDGD